MEYAIALDWVKEVKELTKTDVDLNLNEVIQDKGALSTKELKKKLIFYGNYFSQELGKSGCNSKGLLLCDHNWKWTPLTLALYLGHLEIADYLLESGVDPMKPVIFSRNQIQPPLFFLMHRRNQG